MESMFVSEQRPEAKGRPAARPRLERAVVLGGSFAGLLVARVLSEHAAQVTVIERDRPSSSPGEVVVRKGVPQGHHAHLLLRSGLSRVRSLFPGIEQELEQVAGPAFDMVREILWKVDGEFRPRFESDYLAYGLGRPALEAVVRRRVEALPNVRFVYGSSASSLEIFRGRVTGVKLGYGRILGADLVIDASGRGTRVPAWLERAGYPRVEEQTVELGLTYTSSVLVPRAGAERDFRVLLVPPVHPRCPRGGLLLPLEGGRLVATLLAYGEAAPRTWTEFVARAEQVDDPLYAEVVKSCEPVGDLASFGIPRQIWRHYERASQMPERLLVVGDALCSFDPAFGQGISVAALEASELEQLLRERDLPLDELGARYFQRAASVIATPWTLARTRAPSATLEGAPRLQRWLRDYQRELMRAAAHSRALHLAFVRVVNLEASPTSLLAPGLALRVLGHRLRRFWAGASASLRGPSERTIGSAPPAKGRVVV